MFKFLLIFFLFLGTFFVGFSDSVPYELKGYEIQNDVSVIEIYNDPINHFILTLIYSAVLLGFVIWRFEYGVSLAKKH